MPRHQVRNQQLGVKPWIYDAGDLPDLVPGFMGASNRVVNAYWGDLHLRSNDG